MGYLILKTGLSALLIVAISEASKQSTLLGSILASLPLVSVLAMAWMHHEGQDAAQIGQFATGVFWLVLPSLVLFIALPLLLRLHWGFYPALGLASLATMGAYYAMVWGLGQFGIKL